jgi:hypothetical protein
MIEWLKSLFCEHEWETVYPYDEEDDDYLRYVMRYRVCKKCGRIK